MTGLENNPLYKCCMDMWDRSLVGKKMAFDIGANNGGFSRTLAIAGLKVHAYEPVPDMYEELVKVAVEYPTIIPHRLMVADFIGDVGNLNVFSAWTILPDDTKWGKALEYEGKPSFHSFVTTVDHQSINIGECPDFIKLDVDGYENKVLEGAVISLRIKKPPILFEYSFLLEKVGDSPVDMVNLIYDLGYQAWSMDGKYVCKTREQMLACYPAHTSFDCMLIHPENPVA